MRSYFKEIGMSQVEIAEKLGVSKKTVNNLLTGYSKFGKAQAEKWHDVFGISKSFLLTGDGNITGAGAEEQVEGLNATIQDLNSVIVAKNAIIAERDKTIAKLMARIAELEKPIK